jgi:hypothetical protein
MSGSVQRLLAGELLATDSASEVCNAAIETMTTWIVKERQVSMDPGGEVRPWLVFESSAWEVGERLREVVSKKRRWREDGSFLDLVAWVLGNDAFLRGRQPFVELGMKWDPERTLPLIPKLLRDPDVKGQAIAALRQNRVPGFGREVEVAVVGEKKAWIRKEARKYVELGI